MAKSKKLEIELVEEGNTVNNSVTDFELNAEIVAGTLKTNAIELAKKVNAELENYKVEKYLENPDLAKSDKTLLNKIKDSVAAKRKEVTSKWNQPLEEFLGEMKNLEKTISEASEKINAIVKEAENKEKAEKRAMIERYYSTLNTIVSLDKIFNPKWLNKTVKMETVMLEIETITDKISGELATIRSMKDEDSEVLQSFYLDTLDLNATLQKGNQLKANRETIKKVAEEKPAITTVTTVEEAEKNGYTAPKKEENQINNNDPIMDYNLILHGTRSKLVMVRKYMESIGVTYTKVGN